MGAQFADQSRVERIGPFGPVERRDLDRAAAFDQQFAHNVCPSSMVKTLPVMPSAESEQSSSNGAWRSPGGRIRWRGKLLTIAAPVSLSNTSTVISDANQPGWQTLTRFPRRAHYP